MAKPSMSEIFELVPQIMENLEGVKIKPPDIFDDESLKAFYVSIYCEDDATFEKIKKLLPTMLNLIAQKGGATQ